MHVCVCVCARARVCVCACVHTCIITAPTCCHTHTILFTYLCTISHSHHTDNIGCARNNTINLYHQLISDMINWLAAFTLTSTWYSTRMLSKQVLSCVQFREMEVLKEFTAVMNGGLGVAVHEQRGYLYRYSIIHIVILCR